MSPVVRRDLSGCGVVWLVHKPFGFEDLAETVHELSRAVVYALCERG